MKFSNFMNCLLTNLIPPKILSFPKFLKSGKKCLVPNRKSAITLRLFAVQISFNYHRKDNAEQILNIQYFEDFCVETFIQIHSFDSLQIR